jgi:translation elongation factor EF-1alpha
VVFIRLFLGGQLKPGMELMVMTPKFPAGVKLVVNRIETKNKQIQEANPWDIIGIEFKKVPLSKHSDVYTYADLYYQVKNICRFGALIVEKNRAPKQVKSFVAALAFVSTSSQMACKRLLLTLIFAADSEDRPNA